MRPKYPQKKNYKKNTHNQTTTNENQETHIKKQTKQTQTTNTNKKQIQQTNKQK